MGKGRGKRPTGGRSRRTRVVHTLANPEGNRAQRRAAAAFARMSPERQASTPKAAQAPPPERWAEHPARPNGR